MTTREALLILKDRLDVPSGLRFWLRHYPGSAYDAPRPDWLRYLASASGLFGPRIVETLDRCLEHAESSPKWVLRDPKDPKKIERACPLITGAEDCRSVLLNRRAAEARL